MVFKKFQALCLCVALSVSLAGCNGENLRKQPETEEGSSAKGESLPKGQDNSADSKDAEDKAADSENSTESKAVDSEDSQEEALLGPDATDEDLLEVLKDDVTVITDDNYMEMVSAFTENTEEYTGQIYQVEGTFATEDGNPYITRTAVDGGNQTPSRMPLKYVGESPEEGAWVRVTGIVSYGEVDGESVPVLEVVVLQELKQQSQAEPTPDGKED